MAPTSKKKLSTSKKKIPKMKKKPLTKTENIKMIDKDDYLWVYGHPISKKSCYEFHNDLQEYLENAYNNRRKKCKIYVFGTYWTIDFQKMLKTRKNADYRVQIQRIQRSKAKKFGVMGISGVPYVKTEGFKQTDNMCNICLYKPSIPTRIESCGHEFCYICLKSNFVLGLECPTCRGDIPSQLFDVPIRYDLDIHMECPEEYANDCASMFTMSEDGKGSAKVIPPLRRSTRSTRTKYYWIYESKSFGWYRYDPKNEKYLEESYFRKKMSCTLFICGYKMSINLKDGVQERLTDGEVHRRKIKRILASDIDNHCVKGIAGIHSYVHPVFD